MQKATGSKRYRHLRPIFEPERHRTVPADHDLVDDGQPKLLVKLRDGKRAVLNVPDESVEDFALAEPLALLRFQFFQPL
jgi:hypothetical protein